MEGKGFIIGDKRSSNASGRFRAISIEMGPGRRGMVGKNIAEEGGENNGRGRGLREGGKGEIDGRRGVCPKGVRVRRG